VSQNYDVVIAGGGVIGAACAYYLSKGRDLSVAVIDDKRPGNASRASAGGLWAIGESVGLGCGVIFFRTTSAARRVAGADAAPAHPHVLPACFFDLAFASNQHFPALHRELKECHGVDFKFEQTGLKFIMYDDDDLAYARLIEASVPHLRSHMAWLDASQLREAEPHVTPAAIGALEFTCDHQVNPYRLTDALLEAARQNGAALYPNEAVIGVQRRGRRVTGVVTSRQGNVGCSTLINAAGSWAAEVSQWASGTRLPVEPVKGQIVLSEKLPPLLRGCVSTSDCYFMQKDNGEILIGSTTENKGYDTGTTLEELRGLARGAVRCVPALRQFAIKRCWAGLRPGTPDELPILGPMAGVEGYLNACGHFRTGILMSAITGVVLDRLVRHQPPPLDITPFLASRFRPAQPPRAPSGAMPHPELAHSS